MTIAGKGGRPLGYPKSGGRKTGTPNKATLEVAERLAALGCDPLAGLAGIAMDKNSSRELSARCYAELLPYVYPKRKPVDRPNRERSLINVNTNLDG